MFLRLQNPSILKIAKNIVKKRINVRSIDYDGCLSQHHKVRDVKKLIARNKEFLSNIANNIKEEKFDEVITIVGSNRQCHRVDKHCSNRYGTSSAFIAIEHVTEELKKSCPECKFSFDRYLQADAYNDLDDGTSLDSALQSYDKENHQYLEEKLSQPHAVRDPTKLSLLYTQMHRIASKHRNDEIIFDFYDNEEGIISYLTSVFSDPANHFLIPNNVKLRIHQHSREVSGKVMEVQGIGRIDFSYKNSLMEMARMCCHEENDSVMKKQLDIVKFKWWRNWRDLQKIFPKARNDVLMTRNSNDSFFSLSKTTWRNGLLVGGVARAALTASALLSKR